MEYQEENNISEQNTICLDYKKKKKYKLLPWSEKYRPESIEKIIYHEKITKAIVSYLDNSKLPHLLLYGPPGTGKTSTIIAIAKQYYKEDYDNMILVLNASEERGIETVRNRIKQFVICKGIIENKNTLPFKLIILDEIDAMTEDAQAILRKVIEKYVSNVRFCFICNYLKKINPAIQSRCVIFRFNPIPNENMHNFIIKICDNENINISLNALNLIIKISNGDIRKLLNIMQSIYMYLNNLNINEKNKKSIIIKEDTVAKILSCPTKKNIEKILTFIKNNNIKDSYNYISTMVCKNSLSLIEIINYVYEYCMDKLLGKNNILNYSNEKIILIIKKICLINENLTYCNNDNIQLISFISIFYMEA